MAPRTSRSTVIPEPTTPALTFRGEKPTPGMIMRLFRRGMAEKPQSRKRILEVQAFRRMDPASMIQLNPRWVRNNPEAAAWVQDVRHERITLEQEQVARAGAVEPEFVCEALGDLERDETAKEEKEAYLEEWRVSKLGPPTQAFFGKSVEDGEYARVTLPSHLDIDGMPDFFEMLDRRAYARLSDERKAEYRPDEDDRRGRYVGVDKDGKKRLNRRFDKGDDEKSKAAHDLAVQRYLLGRQASNTRLIPALNCAPIFDTGKGRDRWELVALVERTLYYPEELLDAGYGWKGLGDRRLVPLAYQADGSRMRIGRDEVGVGAQLYLYAAYLMCRDEDDCRRPAIFYTVGGTSTWDAASGHEDDPDSVGVIDLCHELRRKDGTCPALEGRPLWSYHFGLHSEDDSPDHYGRPHMYPVMRRIKILEGNRTSMNAAVTVNAFTGHFSKPDAALAAELPDEALLEEDRSLKKDRMPGPGEIEPTVSTITPAQQATISPDAWRQHAADEQALAQASATDHISDASGHAMVVGETLAKVGQRHQREGVLEAVTRSGEDHLRIVHAIYEAHGVAWPIQTVMELPVGKLGEVRTANKIVAYSPDWVGENNFGLKMEYPEEENLARQDLEMSAAERGFGSSKRVYKAFGEKDPQRAYIETIKDKLRNHPLYTERIMLGLSQRRGDREMVQILKQLRQQQELTTPVGGIPGMANGIPSAALKRAGQGPAPANRATFASRSRGGIAAAEKNAASRTVDAEAQMQVGQGVA